MITLTPRQKEILGLVIEAYITTTLPVGSRTLGERYQLNLSSASVRHEMGILEEMGYLTHPHTSAGRVPTDKGYHFYVREIAAQEAVPEELLRFVSREMQGKIENLESFMGRTSRILSAMAEEAVLVLSPKLGELYLKEFSLIPLDENRLLAVWCATSGLVGDCVVEMGEPIGVEEVERIRHFINEELVGEPIANLEEKLLKKLESQRDSLKHLYERTLQIIQDSRPYWAMPRIFVEGSRYILNQPEFQDLKKLQLLVATLEEKSSLVDLLVQSPHEKGIRVAIGEKELSKDIWDCSLVSAPYYWRGKYVGAVGVLGPRRMRYGRIMGLVQHMAQEIGQTLTRWGS